jgi:glycosyltransferase involved in cell wall biosynthesis
MSKLREITVFTTGDSSKPTTWSNVPYFFTETLIRKGIKVNRVNIGPNPKLNHFWDKTMWRIARHLVNRKTTFTYFRSAIHNANVKRRIKKAVNEFPASDVFLFLTFSFSSKDFTNKPTVLFSDWTYEHHIRQFENRKPDILEQQCINRENKCIEEADLILPLFPAIAEHMKARYTNKNIYYLGNVINSVLEADAQKMIAEKISSFDILFVGSPKYLEGALSLIAAFKLLKSQFPELRLHFVGLTQFEIGIELPADVVAHGYLDKGKDEDRKLYYSLFSKARMFINTTPQWGAFSATIEAMYFYTPVVVTAYDEFVRTFGHNPSFGIYAANNTPEEIAYCVASLLENDNSAYLFNAAHNAVKEFTWDAYVDKVVALVEQQLV